MASDDPKLPRVTLRDEKLYVEGEKDPYFQDSGHTIRLRVRELTILRGYQPDYSNPAAPKVLAELLRGMAELRRAINSAVIGFQDKPESADRIRHKPGLRHRDQNRLATSFGFAPATGSLIGKKASVSTATAQDSISTTYSPRFGEATSTTFSSTSRPLCGRRTSRRGMWRRQTTTNTATPSRL